MLTIIVFIFATFGFTLIVTKSKICKPFRDFCTGVHRHLGYFVGCPMCIGFWAGIAVYLLQKYEVNIVLYGFLGSVFSYTMYLIIAPLIKKYD